MSRAKGKTAKPGGRYAPPGGRVDGAGVGAEGGAGPARGSLGGAGAAGGGVILPDVGAACRLVVAAVANDAAAIDAAAHGEGVDPDRLLSGLVALVLMQAEASPGGLRSLPRFLRRAEGQAEAAGL